MHHLSSLLTVKAEIAFVAGSGAIVFAYYCTSIRLRQAIPVAYIASFVLALLAPGA